MSCAGDQSVSFTFQGIRALAKTMKKSGQPVYFCGASHSVEDILQGADPSVFISFGNVREAELRLGGS